jgi:hypothetical protein
MIGPKYQYNTFSNLSLLFGVADKANVFLQLIKGNDLEKYLEGAWCASSKITNPKSEKISASYFSFAIDCNIPITNCLPSVSILFC